MPVSEQGFNLLEQLHGEVGTWDHCFLRRKTWPAAALRDLPHGKKIGDHYPANEEAATCYLLPPLRRVYKETVDSLGESADSEPVPISSSQKAGTFPIPTWFRKGNCEAGCNL